MSENLLSSEETIALFDQYVIPNYGRYPVNLVRGEGSRIWDSEGNEYLDLFPGWGCNLLGHCPPRIVEAVQRQVAQLIHVPNTWYMQQQGQWAKLLCERAFDSQAFFCNSGAEANEGAIKLARLHTDPERYKIITFTGGFHGRTLGALTATAQPKYHEGLGPLVAGFTYCPFGDLDAVRDAIDDKTCAVMVEPIQGEGGVKIPGDDFLPGLRKLCDQHGLVLIFDEVQTGCGRTGHWFAHQHFGVEPDIMTLAKSLCGGVAGGGILARPEVAASLKPGTHAATFGGNPIAAAAGIAAIETIEADGLLEQAQSLGASMKQKLDSMAEAFELIREVRVCGVMIGIELDIEGTEIVAECMRRGVLINCTQGNVLRLLPAMNLAPEEAHRGLDVIAEALQAVGSQSVEA